MFRNKKTEKINEILVPLLKRMGIDEKYFEMELLESWSEIVGKLIASKTKELFMHNQVLYLSFTSSVVRNELMMSKDSLIQKINNYLGQQVVKEIRFK